MVIKKNVTLTGNQSIILQAMAMGSLLAELESSKFVKSDYFNKMHFDNESHKEILKLSGIGNPATMHFMLYAYLVMPKEMLPREKYEKLVEEYELLNRHIATIVEKETSSTYPKEENLSLIDHCCHMRNSIAHSKSLFEVEKNVPYVTFFDERKTDNSECKIKIRTLAVGEVLNKLQEILNRYFINTL